MTALYLYFYRILSGVLAISSAGIVFITWPAFGANGEPNIQPRDRETLRYLPDTEKVSSVALNQQAPLQTYAQILHAKTKEIKIYRLSDNLRIFIVDFPSLHAQALALNRVASLIEKMGLPDNRVIQLNEMENYFKTNRLNPDTFYFGHNYKAGDLADFFNKVKRDLLQLNSEETAFLQQLENLGVLEQHRGQYKTPDPLRVVLTLTQTQKDNPDTPEPDFVDLSMRCTILRHELSHGEFSTNVMYRRTTKNFWERTLKDADRAAFNTFLHSKGYEAKGDAGEDLMANETQAYLMHSPNPRAFTPERAGLTSARAEELRQLFLAKDNSWLHRVFYPKEPVPKQQLADLQCNF